MSKIKESVCAVVVTYNRKHLLLNCLEALKSQTYPLDAIYIIDNASNDGTPNLLMEKGYIGELPPGDLKEPWEGCFEINDSIKEVPIKIYYVRVPENVGGAGGFYEGVKRAYERGYDWLWLMDDDGLPKNDCLGTLMKYKSAYHFMGPLLLRLDEPDKLVFPIWKGRLLMDIEDVKLKAKDGLIEDVAFLFNGVLASKTLVGAIGYPKKEMFIYGDEVEYSLRALSKGFKVITVIDAIFYHPKSRINSINIFMGKCSVLYPDNPLRNYCLFRNIAYINSRYLRLKMFMKDILKYSWFYIVTRRLDIRGFIFYIRATVDGLLGVWGKERVYLSK